MRRKAKIVTYLGIRSHFSAAMLPRPFFGCPYQISSDPVHTVLRLYKPAFQITYLVRMTILDKRPNACLQKTDELSAAGFRHGNKLGVAMLKDVHHLGLVLVLAHLIPKVATQHKPTIQITILQGAHDEILFCH